MTPQELKNSILQLAIQGKLVEQRPEEGTGEELYRQIQAEKKRLIKEGKIKKEKPLPEIEEDEKPFDIPESWKWCRLSEVIDVRDGTHDSPKYVPVGIPLVTSKNLVNGVIDYSNVKYITQEDADKINARSMVVDDDILFAMIGSIGNPVLVKKNREFCIKNMALFKRFANTEISMRYVYWFLFYAQYKLKKEASGGVQSFISLSRFREYLVPLPPVAEQKRIVAKIEELLPYIDRYAASYERLEQVNTEFQEDMKKSVLQYAIQGKLVEQRPEEGTGEELYRQIQAEKQKLIKAGKIKKDKPLPEIAEDEIPFDIPESWKWVRLSDLCKSISDGDHQPPPQVSNGIPFLVISNVSSGTIDFTNTRYVSKEYFGALSADRIAEKGDVLFTVTGSYGIPVKVDCDQAFCFQRHIALLKLLIDWDYLFFALKSPVIKLQCDAIATGTAQKTVGLKSLRSIVIPLPPLEEQKRIVAKLEEILLLCERLRSPVQLKNNSVY